MGVLYTVNIYRYKTIEANGNTSSQNTSVFPSAYIGDIGKLPFNGNLPIGDIGKLPLNGNLPIEAKGIPDVG